MKKKVVFVWSGGKDSALALYRLTRDKEYRIVSLLSLITEDYKRVSMQGFPETLLKQQVEALGIPLDTVYISKNASNKGYEERMAEKLRKYKGEGIFLCGFGDIFLSDVRTYREENLKKLEMKAVFPLWGEDTKQLAYEFCSKGFSAIITCVDTFYLDKRFVGRNFDREFLENLPQKVDPCGERGEFHSFVYDGPLFKKRVNFLKGDTVLREERFYYCDLIEKG